MSTPNHTPTPWILNPDATGEEGEGWVQADQPGVGRVDIFLRCWWSHADAARIVQCVNACEGIDDPADKIARWKADERAEADLRAHYAARYGLGDPKACWDDIVAAAERHGMARAADLAADAYDELRNGGDVEEAGGAADVERRIRDAINPKEP